MCPPPPPSPHILHSHTTHSQVSGSGNTQINMCVCVCASLAGHITQESGSHYINTTHQAELFILVRLVVHIFRQSSKYL